MKCMPLLRASPSGELPLSFRDPPRLARARRALHLLTRLACSQVGDAGAADGAKSSTHSSAEDRACVCTCLPFRPRRASSSVRAAVAWCASAIAAGYAVSAVAASVPAVSSAVSSCVPRSVRGDVQAQLGWRLRRLRDERVRPLQVWLGLRRLRRAERFRRRGRRRCLLRRTHLRTLPRSLRHRRVQSVWRGVQARVRRRLRRRRSRLYAYCALGSDCADCGVRLDVPPGSAAPPAPPLPMRDPSCRKEQSVRSCSPEGRGWIGLACVALLDCVGYKHQFRKKMIMFARLAGRHSQVRRGIRRAIRSAHTGEKRKRKKGGKGGRGKEGSAGGR